MRALKIFETLDFERGQEPAEAMKLGKYRHSELRKALVTGGTVEMPDMFQEWLYENPLLKEKLEYSKKDKYGATIAYYCIELDNYTEDRNIDREELEKEFVPEYSFPPVKPGECRVKIGTIADGSKVIYYQGGNVDGFITRKDWLR
jgi:hypothetical protein